MVLTVSPQASTLSAAQAAQVSFEAVQFGSLDEFATSATNFAIAAVILALTAVLALQGIYEFGVRRLLNRYLYAQWYATRRRRKFASGEWAEIFDEPKQVAEDGRRHYRRHWWRVANQLRRHRSYLASQIPIPQSLYSLPYQQFCSQLDMYVQSRLAADLARKAEGEQIKSSESLISEHERHHLLTTWARLIDELQVFMGTWWTRLNYVFSAVLILALTVAIGSVGGWGEERDVVVVIIGVVAALVAPLLHRPVERLMVRR